jgi:hypothetical protein
MTRLERDLKRHAFGQKVLAISFVGLFLSAAVGWLLGLSESELYDRYPWSWWVAITLGVGSIWGLFYLIKKQYDLHPNIQLRREPDEHLRRILRDPDYEMWHSEAERLLTARAEKERRKAACKERI